MVNVKVENLAGGGFSRRIAVVGTSGSGKTTLASKLAQRLGVPHIELDALYWAPGWTSVPRDLFRQRVAQALGGDSWTTDGNYSTARDIVWSRANMVVWLDYPLPVVLGRVTWRTIRRSVKREVLWNGNRESLFTAFFSRESIILWTLNTYHRRRREYPLLFSQPQYAHLDVVHLHSTHATHRWLEDFQATDGHGER